MRKNKTAATLLTSSVCRYRRTDVKLAKAADESRSELKPGGSERNQRTAGFGYLAAVSNYTAAAAGTFSPEPSEPKRSA